MTGTVNRVLITGVAGFLGSALAIRMAVEGWEVHGLDIVPRQDAWRLKGVDIEYHWGSCHDFKIENTPYVIHCASQGDVPLGISAPQYTVVQNVQGTLSILESALRYDGLERFVLQSTEEVYGYTTHLPTTEDEPLNPTSVYGATKGAQELLTRAYCNAFGLPMTIIRSSTIFGEGMRRTQVIPIFLEQALRGEALTIHGDGKQTRDFHWIDDHVEAMIVALTHPAALGLTFNIGSGEERSVLDVANLCIQAAQSSSRIDFTLQRAGEENLRVVLDSTRAQKLLGYEVRVRFEDGLERMVAWLRHNETTKRRAAALS